MLIGSKDPQRAEDLFLSANGEVKEHNEIRYIIIKDKPESNETESGN
jgi:hypothetical protein